MTASAYFIIEHRARGCLQGRDPDTGTPRFMLGFDRAHGQVKRFASVMDAISERHRIPGRYATDCRIRRSDDWKVVA